MGAFQVACERTRGGSTYSEKMAEWFDMSHTAASHWATIGRNREKLYSQATKLPPPRAAAIAVWRARRNWRTNWRVTLASPRRFELLLPP